MVEMEITRKLIRVNHWAKRGQEMGVMFVEESTMQTNTDKGP